MLEKRTCPTNRLISCVVPTCWRTYRWIYFGISTVNHGESSDLEAWLFIELVPVINFVSAIVPLLPRISLVIHTGNGIGMVGRDWPIKIVCGASSIVNYLK